MTALAAAAPPAPAKLAAGVKKAKGETEGEKAKEDRRFESPLLQQRVSANHCDQADFNSER